MNQASSTITAATIPDKAGSAEDYGAGDRLLALLDKLEAESAAANAEATRAMEAAEARYQRSSASHKRLADAMQRITDITVALTTSQSEATADREQATDEPNAIFVGVVRRVVALHKSQQDRGVLEDGFRGDDFEMVMVLVLELDNLRADKSYAEHLQSNAPECETGLDIFDFVYACVDRARGGRVNWEAV